MSDQDNTLVEILNSNLQLGKDLIERIHEIELNQLSEDEKKDLKKVISAYKAYIIAFKIIAALAAAGVPIVIALYKLHEFLNKINL